MESDNKRREMTKLIATDEKARQVLRSLSKGSEGGQKNLPFRISGNDPLLDKLKKLEVIDEQGNLRCQEEDIRDMLGESPKYLGFSREYIEKWESMLQNGEDMLFYLAEQVNPKVYGLLNVKKTIVLALASGEDRWGDRGRIHVLLYGPPGTAKSAVGEWLMYNLNIEGISHRSSDVGLTGCTVGREVVPGALPCANDSSLYIDELDKFDRKDMIGLLQAMESGEVIIRVGSVKARFDARARVVATANKIDKMPPELLDRFDFCIELQQMTVSEEVEVAAKIVEQWKNKKPTYFGKELREYLQWIKSYEPPFPEEVREKGKKLLQMYIEMNENVRGSMRKKEMLIRIASSIAKLHKRAIQTRDFYQAISLTNSSFEGSRIEEAMKAVVRPKDKVKRIY